MSSVRIQALALALVAPLAARAIDAPHEAGTNCSACHMGHNAPGGSLTHTAGNASLCFSCHQFSAKYGWGTSDLAIPGTSGTSHHWSAPATNLGATPPAPGTPMGNRLDGGNLTCSTCHDQHNNGASASGGTQQVTAITPTRVGASTGVVSFAAGSPTAAATAKFYRIEITGAGSESTTRFRLSNDKGLSWLGCAAPGAYVQYVASPSNACAAGASVPLNDGTKVTVAFGAGSYAAGDRFDFHVAYPFLRVANVDAAMCVECHRDRAMHWQDAEGGVANGVAGGVLPAVTLGTTRFSHPVGQALNQGGRTNGLPGGILDANGMVQATSADTNETNDLVTGTGGVVTCLTCHHPHGADSNSISVDPR